MISRWAHAHPTNGASAVKDSTTCGVNEQRPSAETSRFLIADRQSFSGHLRQRSGQNTAVQGYGHTRPFLPEEHERIVWRISMRQEVQGFRLRRA
jgi:hypothetical protein